MAGSSTQQFLEDSIIVWFNPIIENIQESIERLRQIVNVVQVFNDELDQRFPGPTNMNL